MDRRPETRPRCCPARPVKNRSAPVPGHVRGARRCCRVAGCQRSDLRTIRCPDPLACSGRRGPGRGRPVRHRSALYVNGFTYARPSRAAARRRPASPGQGRGRRGTFVVLAVVDGVPASCSWSSSTSGCREVRRLSGGEGAGDVLPGLADRREPVVDRDPTACGHGVLPGGVLRATRHRTRYGACASAYGPLRGPGGGQVVRGPPRCSPGHSGRRAGFRDHVRGPLWSSHGHAGLTHCRFPLIVPLRCDHRITLSTTAPRRTHGRHGPIRGQGPVPGDG